MHLCHWKRALHCPPWAAMITHQTSMSGHLCCNTESLPHHPRIQSQNYTKILSMQTVTESSHNVSVIQHQLVSVSIFFIYSIPKFVFLSQTWGWHASCTEFPAATAQTRAVACQSLELNMQNAENSHNTSFMMLMKT